MKLKKVIFYLIETLILFFVRDFDIKSKQIPMVILCKPLGIGDLIMLSPLINLLKTKYDRVIVISDYEEFLNLKGIEWYPRSSISDVSTENCFYIFPTFCFTNFKIFLRSPGPFIGNLLLDRVISTEKRPLILHHKKDLQIIHYFYRVVPILERLNIDMSAQLKYPKLKSEEFNDNKTNDQYVCIAPFSNWSTRQASFQQFLRTLSILDLQEAIIIIGGGAKQECVFNEKFADDLRRLGYKVKNITGATSLAEVSSVISGALHYIGNDSGLSHIAMLSNVPTTIFDGCVPLQNRMPLNTELALKIVGFNRALMCPKYPCYSGYAEAVCKNSVTNFCLECINENTSHKHNK